MGFGGRITTIHALAAGVCLLIAGSAAAAPQSAIVKLYGGADVSGKIVKASKACTANRKVVILNDGANPVGSATSDSKGRFSASLFSSGGAYAVATKTKRCKKAKSRVVPTGWADLSVSIMGPATNIVATVTNLGPDPSDPGFLTIALPQAGYPVPQQRTQGFYSSLPPGGSQTLVFNACLTEHGTSTVTAGLAPFPFGPSGHLAPADPNKANNTAQLPFTCP